MHDANALPSLPKTRTNGHPKVRRWALDSPGSGQTGPGDTPPGGVHGGAYFNGFHTGTLAPPLCP